MIKLGRRLTVIEVKIDDGEGERIAFVSGTYSIA
jgi:acyl-coenzyme A thioesterase PaaI-like protein